MENDEINGCEARNKPDLSEIAGQAASPVADALKISALKISTKTASALSAALNMQ